MGSLFYLKFVKAIKILIWHSQFFNLIVFNCDNTNFSRSDIRSVISIFAIVIYFLLTFYCLYDIIIYEATAIMVKMCNVLIFILSSVYTITTWICSIMKQDYYIQFLNEIINFDSKIATFDYRLSEKKLERRFVMRYILLTIWCFFEICCYWFLRSDITYVEEIKRFIKIFLNSSICFQCVELVLLIKTRFAVLNRNLLNLTMRKMVDYSTLCEICSLHHSLTKLIRKFNEIFGFILLLMFGMSFVNIVLSFFFLSVELLSSIFSSLRIFYIILSSAGFIIDTIYICNGCYSTIEKVIFFQNVQN